jgi:hypothetical protein
VRHKLAPIIGVGVLGIVLACALLTGSETRVIRDVELLRQQGDQIRLIGPYGPPRLVPPRAPGPGLTA